MSPEFITPPCFAHHDGSLGALTCEVQQAGIGGVGAMGLHNPVVKTWGRCPQTPEIYRFEPEAGFRRGPNGLLSRIRLLHLPC
jgi:hypothetical protein